jgi:hypothetical protein
MIFVLLISTLSNGGVFELWIIKGWSMYYEEVP